MFALRGRNCPSLNTRAVLLVAVSIAIGGVAPVLQSAPVTATRLDGTTLSGELQRLDDGEAVLTTSAGEQRIPVEQLVSLRWPQPALAAKAARGDDGVAELIDGTIIPLKGLVANGKQVTVTLESAGDARPKTVELPVSGIAAVRFQRLDAGLESQWNEIRQQKLASDLLIVLKRDGKSLDYVEGVVGEISDQQVEFKLDGESNRVDRSKVAGIVFLRSERLPRVETRMVLEGRSGVRANVAKAQLVGGGNIELTTTGGVRLSWPVGDIDVADFSGGKFIYLSDIEPASVNWSPLVGLPAGLSLAAEYGQPRRDHSAFGGKLSVGERSNPNDAATSLVTLREFPKGVAIRSRTELVYRLPTGFSRFRAVAGIDPAATASGNVRLEILADEEPLLETEIASDDAPQTIDVEIAGAKRLKILVDFGKNQDSGDWLNLCDAKLVK